MKQQRGGTLVGFIAGVIVGLASALVVAVYITKVPVPFMNKGQLRNADQDQAEAEKNRNWDPNAQLHGKNPAKPADTGTGATTSPPAVEPAPPVPATAPAATPASPATPAATPGPAASAPTATASRERRNEARAAAPADPLGDLARARSGAVEETYSYFVQLGAWRTMEEAESQRAKFSLTGIDTKISEYEQSGRTVYRVRVGPFNKKEEGENNKEKLDKAGLQTTLVRVPR